MNAVISLEELPTFPVSEAKIPLVKDWPHWAKPHRIWELGNWPLIGVVAGEASGIDCCDFDPRGLSLFNEWPVPATRSHLTRRGIHVLFRHEPGLRKSENHALGIDIRADGGMFIWWPGQGLEVLWPKLLAP